MPQFFSPAKINLFLKIVGKRPDGYHELSSLFQTISLGDTLDIEFNEEDLFTCNDPSLPTDGSNLVSKAIQLYRKKTGASAKFKVHLNKCIPSQAGLGGGSSNAATVLWAINQMMGAPATTKELQIWAAEIGSDVPFFFSLGTAHCTGRGEHVCNLPTFSSRACLIVKPQIGSSTPEVYRRLKLESLQSPQSDYFNDLEQPAFEVSSTLRELKNGLLKGGFETVLMTGSGSAFFCLGSGCLPPDPDLFSHLATFINRSPLTWYSLNF